MRWYLVKRLAWAIAAAWIVVSAMFLLMALTTNPNEAVVGWAAGKDTEMVEQWRARRNYHLPIHERYWLYLTSLATLDWGTTFDGAPVASSFATAIPITLLYVVPSMIASTVIGVAIGMYTAVHEGGLVDRLGTPLVYSGFSVPVFWLSQLVILGVGIHEVDWIATAWDSELGMTHPENLQAVVLPAIIVTGNMLAVQARFTRSEAFELLPEEFVRRLRASGADAGDVARHVLRNASLVLVSLFFLEGLGLLVVTVYVVEAIFHLPGVGSLAHSGIINRDPNVVLPATLLIALVGIGGNLFQDLLYVYLDPRVDYDGGG